MTSRFDTSRDSRDRVVSRSPPLDDTIDRSIKELFSEDYGVRASAVDALAGRGEAAAHALVEVIFKKRGEPHALTNFSDALAEIGKPSLPALLEALDRMSEIKRPDDVYLLETLADLVGLLEDRRAIPRLREKSDKLHGVVVATREPLLRDCCQAARIRLLRVLFELGDRGGTNDLLSILGDGRRRLPHDLVDLLGRAGNKQALIPLARLHAIEEPVSFTGAHLIRESIRQIAHRERFRLNDPLLRGVDNGDRAALERILPKSRPDGA